MVLNGTLSYLVDSHIVKRTPEICCAHDPSRQPFTKG
jgi:hypothetical protein